MSYLLKAVIGPRLAFQSETPYTHVKVVSLPQGFVLIPFTEKLDEDIHGRPSPDYDPEEDERFGRPSEEIDDWMKRISAHGKIAYIEVECWGGDCAHAGTVWESGKIILGPLKTLSGKDYGPSLSETGVNKALRMIGVHVTQVDEFWSLGLQKYRYTDEWK